LPRRKKRLDEMRGVDLAIIITPMLDMAFQLLAFFIMTYHPPLREAAVDGTLLPASVLSGGGKDTKKVDVDPVVRMKLRIIVKAVPLQGQPDQPLQPGQPTSIAVERPPLSLRPVAVVKEPGARPGDPPADWAAALKALAEELAETMKDSKYRNLELSIDGDRALRYGYIIAVREVAEASGFKKIGFNAPR
jgi:biopolymer transport protein ExbD